MIAKNAYEITNRSLVTLPFLASRKPERNHRTNLFSSNTTSETIEILERSSRKHKDSNHLASASLFAASVIMICTAASVLLSLVPVFLEANINFSFTDVVRVIAGR